MVMESFSILRAFCVFFVASLELFNAVCFACVRHVQLRISVLMYFWRVELVFFQV